MVFTLTLPQLAGLLMLFLLIGGMIGGMLVFLRIGRDPLFGWGQPLFAPFSFTRKPHDNKEG